MKKTAYPPRSGEYRPLCDLTPHVPDEVSGDFSVRLVIAVLQQAVSDYFIFYRAGAVSHLIPTGHFPRRISSGSPVLLHQGMTPSDLYALLRFFREDMHRLLRMVGVHVTPDEVVRIVRRAEAAYEWPSKR